MAVTILDFDLTTEFLIVTFNILAATHQNGSWHFAYFSSYPVPMMKDSVALSEGE